MQHQSWEEEKILVVVSKTEEPSLHDFCCRVRIFKVFFIFYVCLVGSWPGTVFDLGYLSDLAAMLSACPQSTHQTGTFSDDCMHFIVCVRPAATTLVSSWVQVADQYSYNISVFVVDNSDPDSALSDLELLTSYSHFELVVLGAEIDFCIKQALRQVHTHCSLGTQKAACI